MQWQQQREGWELRQHWRAQQLVLRQQGRTAPVAGSGGGQHLQDLLRQQTELQTLRQGLEQQLAHLAERLQLNELSLEEQFGHHEWRGWLERADGEQAIELWRQGVPGVPPL